MNNNGMADNSKELSLGILGVGAYLPEQVRENDFWPAEVVDRWRERNGNFLLLEPDIQVTDGVKLAFEAIKASRSDPFQGARSRRVLPDDKVTSDMEVEAARTALERAQRSLGDIDLLLCQTTVPDHLGVNHAAILHRKLGLRSSVPAVVVDSVCTSFLMQMQLAQQMMRGGVIRNALLVQSSTLTRMTQNTNPHSAWFGDGATAVVVGPVSEGRGLLAMAFNTDGGYANGPLCGVPGKRWHDEGKISIYTGDAKVTQRMFLDLPDMARGSMHQAFRQTELSAKDVQFFACHQPLAYARPLTQSSLDMSQAKFVDSFAWTGNLGAANVPFQMFVGEKEGLLRTGDLVAAFTVGAGATWASALIRWGV